jgi:hypothetical protein
VLSELHEYGTVRAFKPMDSKMLSPSKKKIVGEVGLSPFIYGSYIPKKNQIYNKNG